MANDLRTLPLLYLWMARLTSQARFSGEEAMFALDRVEPLLRREDNDRDGRDHAVARPCGRGPAPDLRHPGGEVLRQDRGRPHRRCL